jgi:cysteine synthase
VGERGGYRADQFELYGNLRAHYEYTGPEIWEQSGGSITAFVDFVGSGGTLAGVWGRGGVGGHCGGCVCRCVGAWVCGGG